MEESVIILWIGLIISIIGIISFSYLLYNEKQLQKELEKKLKIKI